MKTLFLSIATLMASAGCTTRLVSERVAVGQHYDYYTFNRPYYGAYAPPPLIVRPNYIPQYEHHKPPVYFPAKKHDEQKYSNEREREHGRDREKQNPSGQVEPKYS